MNPKLLTENIVIEKLSFPSQINPKDVASSTDEEQVDSAILSTLNQEPDSGWDCDIQAISQLFPENKSNKKNNKKRKNEVELHEYPPKGCGGADVIQKQLLSWAGRLELETLDLKNNVAENISSIFQKYHDLLDEFQKESRNQISPLDKNNINFTKLISEELSSKLASLENTMLSVSRETNYSAIDQKLSIELEKIQEISTNLAKKAQEQVKLEKRNSSMLSDLQRQNRWDKKDQTIVDATSRSLVDNGFKRVNIRLSQGLITISKDIKNLSKNMAKNSGRYPDKSDTLKNVVTAINNIEHSISLLSSRIERMESSWMSVENENRQISNKLDKLIYSFENNVSSQIGPNKSNQVTPNTPDSQPSKICHFRNVPFPSTTMYNNPPSTREAATFESPIIIPYLKRARKH